MWETEKPEAGHAHHHLMEMGHQLQLFFFWFKYYLKQEEGKRGKGTKKIILNTCGTRKGSWSTTKSGS